MSRRGLRVPDLAVVPLFLAEAFVSLWALPFIGHHLSDPVRPLDHAAAVRAHVAWSRVVAFALVVAAGVALRRVLLRDPERGARAALVGVLVCASVAGAALLPFYDDALEARARDRYASAPGWTAQPDGGVHARSPVLSYYYQRSVEAQSGPAEVEMPRLEKGDEVRAVASYQGDDVYAFLRAGSGFTAAATCESAEWQLPKPTADHVPYTVLTRTCSARAADASVFWARWGSDEPVPLTLSAIVRPTYANEALARLDETVAFLAALGVIVVHGVAASLAPRRAMSPFVVAALATAPFAVCASWSIAALFWRGHSAWLEPGSAGPTLALLAALAAIAIAGLAFACARGRLEARTTLRAVAFTTVAIALVAPIAAARLWRFDVPWVILGMIATLAIAGFTMRAAERLPRAQIAPEAALSSP